MSDGGKRASFPRFSRTSPPPPIELTDDDLEILRHLARHRFVRTSELYRLLDHRSPDKLSRRLARLYRARYLDRPLSQIDAFRSAGSQPLVYGLDSAGAAYLAKRDGTQARTDGWTGRNRRYTRENLDHTLAVTRFMVDLELACRAREDVALLRFEDFAAGNSPRWPVTLPWHGSKAPVVVAPDAIFGLEAKNADGRVRRSFYFVEVDRGSMTIVPSDSVRRSDAFLYRSSVLRKLFSYAVSHHEGVHRELLGVPAARVLLLTSKAARVEEMRKAAETLVIPHLDVPVGLFLFGSETGDNPLHSRFLDASGAEKSLSPLAG